MSIPTADLRALEKKWRQERADLCDCVDSNGDVATLLAAQESGDMCAECETVLENCDELNAVIVKMEAEPQSDGPPEIPANILAYLEREQERLKGLTSAQILAELRGAAKSQGVCEGGRNPSKPR